MGLLSCCGINKIVEEARLLNDCYPPSKQLVPVANEDLKASQDAYKPLSQELSRLTYYASNRPGKLNRLGKELELRVAGESRKALMGNVKGRISLLISLAILRSLLSECKRDVGLFTSSVIKILEKALQVANKPVAGGGLDLEIAIRTVSVFTSFVTYADGGAFAADDSTLTSYLSVLRRLASLAVQPDTSTTAVLDEKGARDHELRNRTRLIGLAALSAAVQSDVFHTSQSDFRQQAEIIIPALMQNLWIGDMDDLKLQTARVSIDFSPSPYFSEFSARRPVAQRRAPSLHTHIVGQQGPTTPDVIGAALGTLRELLSDCHSSQLADALSVSLDSIDRGFPDSKGTSWGDEARCCWLAESMTRFTMLPYRYTVPSALLERFMLTVQDELVAQSSRTLLKMLRTIWNADKLALTGFSPSEALAILLNAIVIRSRTNRQDDSLLLLVDCVAALGTHAYYVGQADDMIEEVLSRIAELQSVEPKLDIKRTQKEDVNGGISTPVVVTASPLESTDAETIRVLVKCLVTILMGNSDIEDADSRVNDTASSIRADKASLPARAESRTSVRKGRRNPVSPEVWQETLPLLCESSFAVRAEYAKGLLLYLRQELPAYEASTANGSSGEVEKSISRFLHALSATVCSLAITSRLGYAGPALALNSFKPQDEAVTELRNPRIFVDSPTPGISTSQDPLNEVPKMARRTSKLVSLPFNRRHSDARASPVPGASLSARVAGPLDYLIIKEVLLAAFGSTSRLSIIILSPMLLALDRDAGTVLVRESPQARDHLFTAQRCRACREVIHTTWLSLAEHYELGGLKASLRESLGNLPEPFILPNGTLADAESGLLSGSQPISFPPILDPAAASQPVAHPDLIISQIAESPLVQRQLDMSARDITDTLGRPWTVEAALENSVEINTAVLLRSASKRSLNMSPMKGSTHSVDSHDGQASWGVDVEGLRGALVGGRSRPQTGTLSASPSFDGLNGGLDVRRNHSDEAKEILKDIFRERKARASNNSTSA